MLKLITDLGDSAFVLPASVLLCAYLLVLGQARNALLLTVAVVVCAALTLASKLAFFALYHFDGHWVPLGIHSPSGHASLSAVFYMSLSLLVALRRDRGPRIALLSAAAAVVGGVAVTRVMLGAHTIGETCIGLLIGAGCAIWFARAVARQPIDRLPWPPLAFGFVAVAALVHGLDLDGSRIFGSIAHHLRLMLWPTTLP